MSRTKQLERELSDSTPRKEAIPSNAYLSLGCVLINMAVSGRCDGGVAKGQYVFFVGDSSSGKTLVTLHLLAEACMNKNFDKHQLIYDGPEYGNKFNIEKFFGKTLARRMRPPNGTRNDPVYSSTVQEFFYSLRRTVKQRPTIYILDSMDALTDLQEDAKFEEEADATDSGKVVKGSYQMSKPKYISQNIKRAVSWCVKTGSILVIICQTRDMVGAQFKTKTRSGGYAMKFYADIEIWTSIKGDLKRTVMKKEREYGKQVVMDIRKNRTCGWEGKIDVPILRNVGVDDVGASIDYLTSEKIWKSTNGIIKAPQFKFKGRKEDLVAKIESSDKRIQRLAFLVQSTWLKIDDATTLKRRKRYT